MDISVFAQEQRDPRSRSDSKIHRYPQLIFFGWFNNPAVYQLITEGEALKTAKGLGFNMVQFSSKGGLSTGFGGSWFFDLSGATLPLCDLGHRVCR